MPLNNVFIIGGGASIKEFDLSLLKDKGLIIGIKDSFLYTDCHAGLNMDREWFEHRHEKIADKANTLCVPFYNREGCNRNLTGLYETEPFRVFYGITYTDTLTSVEGYLNGAHSGLKAVNLAYQWFPDRIFCLGFDMGPYKGEAYWYPFYEYHPTKKLSGKYTGWATQFAKAREQCQDADIALYNVGPCDRIPDLANLSFKEFSECLSQP